MMIGLIPDDVLYFKGDEQNRQAYPAPGSEQFSYDRKGTPARMSYYRLPTTKVVDNLGQLITWLDAT